MTTGVALPEPDTRPRSDTHGLHALVEALPERYQPIYGHPELSHSVSRACADRLGDLVVVHDALAAELGRPLRVLDLGCAQGFFSLNLAARGSLVVGLDFAPANVAVCQALAAEHPSLNATFLTGRIEEFAALIGPDDFDLVLGLSVFHHLVHEHGVAAICALIGRLAAHIPHGLYELALKGEPLYWGPSQPEDPRTLLAGYRAVRRLGEHATHLSSIGRPLFFVSDLYEFDRGALQRLR